MFCLTQIRPESQLLLLFLVLWHHLFFALHIQGCEYIVDSLSLCLELRSILRGYQGLECAFLCLLFIL